MMKNHPITYISEDIDDLTPLPAMLLHEIRETGVPDLDQLDSSSINRRLMYRNKLKQDFQKRFRLEYLGHLKQNYKLVTKHDPIEVGEIVLVSRDSLKRLELLPLEIRNYSTSTNNFPFSDSPETVCLPDSDVAVTPKVPVDAAIVRIPDENGSPVVRAGGAINKQDETILDASPSITPNDPVPTSPLTVPDDPEPEEEDLGDPSPDKRTIKTRFGRAVYKTRQQTENLK
ncbi:integrase catalytic domain-containing protein [Trichonephila inaurata madagascariensis]|uniref:Integrase catalytic domain-containing protein n=1 Tax=Trichonephila inaurata madagascariensis TaxID=2747483 RepID=A0A8X7C2G2_9ARAC|nr:integrase catalytic domain-containing protein [Trichonephila inaurata madagascariensis]